MFPDGGHAETLHQALERTSAVNPVIQSEYEKSMAAEANLDIAGADRLPSIALNADAGRTFIDDHILNAPDNRSALTSAGYALSLSQKIYDFGRTRAAVSKAEADMMAARTNLRSVVQTVLRDAAISYVNVLRFKAIRRLSRANYNLLDKQLYATIVREKSGALSATDVASARSRRSAAKTDMLKAEADLEASRADFVRLTGKEPSSLIYPRRTPRFPAPSLSSAIRRGVAANPAIIAAQYARDSAKFVLDKAIADRLPDIKLNAGYDHHWSGPGGDFGHKRTGDIRLKGTIPLYQGGALRARIRQARAIVRQKDREIETARAQTRSTIISNWKLMQSARAQMRSAADQIKAAGAALEGIRNEEAVGQRTVLDVLDAERELLDAKVQAAQAKADYLVAYYNLLAAMGRMTTNPGLS
jgi:outer membrane protein